MKKIKYYYNTSTLRYEKHTTPLRVKLLRILGFVCALVVSSALVIYVYDRFVPKPDIIEANRRLGIMKDSYKDLHNHVQTIEARMDALEHRDNDVYRSIFEANPVPDSLRAELIEKKKEIEKLTMPTGDSLGSNIIAQLNNIQNRIEYQYTSYKEIEKLIADQEERLASVPAIQPVANKQLDRVASGFGMRIHPIYAIPKMHNGLDFTAPQGTPIYATANGTVSEAGMNGSAGNMVKINHGYGYETVYMHMLRIKVRAGGKVSRGELIGWVGNTGASTGPHCHYEVHVNGQPVDPVYFFYNDLTPLEFDRLVQLAANGSAKSLD